MATENRAQKFSYKKENFYSAKYSEYYEIKRKDNLHHGLVLDFKMA